MNNDGENTPLASRVLARILDHRKPIDYLLLFFFAAFPIALARWMNVHHTLDGFIGYWERLNWTILVVVLPIAAFALRWIAKRIGPVSSPRPPASLPPLVGLVRSDAGKAMAYTAFRKTLLSPKNLYAAVLITLVIHVVDMAQLGGIYLSGVSQVCPSVDICARELEREDQDQNTEPGTMRWLQVPFAGADLKVEKDWSVAYLNAEKKIGKWPNLALNLCAYAVQFALIFIGILLNILIIRHNLFFLLRIYQRRRVMPGEESSYVHIDLEDGEKCFGFRQANDAFNVQMLALAIAAVFILTTRFANVDADTGLFPDAGQWLAVLTWLVALTIASLPIMVKLLPRMPFRGAERPPASLVGYLREFLSDQDWAYDNNTASEEIDAVAARFAENAFWPTGDERAWQLYFISFWVFFIALVPDLRAVVDLKPWWWKVVGWAGSGVLAAGATWGLLRFLRAMLTYIDIRLVKPPAQPIGNYALQHRRKIPIGVFISYRRDDTFPYTGRLCDSLSRHLDKDRIFMDIDKIPSGVDFVEAVNKAIDSAQAMIVVIGPDWLTIAKDDSPPRIQNPRDYVYQEIALGLQRGIRIFPVLVGGASMPTKDDLPDGLKELATRNAREISNSRWAHDVGLLIKDLGTG